MKKIMLHTVILCEFVFASPGASQDVVATTLNEQAQSSDLEEAMSASKYPFLHCCTPAGCVWLSSTDCAARIATSDATESIANNTSDQPSALPVEPTNSPHAAIDDLHIDLRAFPYSFYVRVISCDVVVAAGSQNDDTPLVGPVSYCAVEMSYDACDLGLSESYLAFPRSYPKPDSHYYATIAFLNESGHLSNTSDGLPVVRMLTRSTAGDCRP